MKIFQSVGVRLSNNYLFSLFLITTLWSANSLAAPNAPIVATSGTTPTNDDRPEWTWTSGEGGGIGEYRVKLDDSNLNSGSTPVFATYWIPPTSLSDGPHTLYVQETDGAQWSESGSFEIVVDTSVPTINQSYLSSGGTLAIFQYNEVLDGASVPSISEFTINHGASATAAYIVDDKVILKLDKTLTAVDQVDGNYVDVQVTYSGSSIIDMAGNEAATFTDRSVDINNSNRYPLTFLISDGVDKVECGAWKIEQDSSGVITVKASNCLDSLSGPSVVGNLRFWDDNLGTGAFECETFDSMKMGGNGRIQINTTNDCVDDFDADGIPGVADADPDVLAPGDCQEVVLGEVNRIDDVVSITSCHGTVAVVTGKNEGTGVGVTIDADTDYTAGEYIRLFPGFSVQSGKIFNAQAGVMNP